MSEHYFQFPISALSYGLDLNNRWKHVLSQCCLEYGYKAMKETPQHAVLDQIQACMPALGVLNSDLDDPAHRALLFGASRLGVPLEGDIRIHLDGAQSAHAHCQHYPFPLVRIRTDLWFKTFTPRDTDLPVSVREFVVLCAVYAGIGSKRFAKLTHLRIRSLASGCPQRNAIEFMNHAKELHPTWLSARQIRTTLDALEANGFFAKFTYLRGECFYSNKMTRSKLAACVALQKLRKLQTVACNRSLDQAESLRIKTLKVAASAPLRKSA